MTQQYLRQASLIVSTVEGAGLDLSQFRIKFAIKKADSETPNTAAIRVYGLSKETSARIEKEFTRIDLQAGYPEGMAVIFSGNIKQTISSVENGTDTFLDIVAADGDEGYNFSVVNATLAAGATQRDQIDAAAKSMIDRGVIPGHIGETPPEKLPRGKVMFGMARDYLRASSQTSAASWSIQNGKLQIIPLTGYLPSQAVVLNSTTGLIGTPEQTSDGIKFRSLLNPLMQIGAQVQIDEKQIQRQKLETDASTKKAGKSVEINQTANAQQKNQQDKQPSPINYDGFYRIISLSMVGDTRGQDWYCEGVGLSIDQTNPTAPVQDE